MKRNVKKIRFKNSDIIKEDAADTLGQGLKDIGGDIKKVFSVFGNSFLRMFKVTISYTKDLFMAKFFYKTSLREVHLKHANLQRSLYRKNKATLDSMSGAKDLDSFLTLVNPNIKSFEAFMNATPEIGEKLDEFSTDARENWNLALKKIYDGDPPDYLVLDTGSSVLPDDKDDAVFAVLVRLLKVVYTKKFADYIDLRNLDGLTKGEQKRLLTKFERNIDKDRKIKIKIFRSNFKTEKELDEFKEELNKTLKGTLGLSDNDIIFFHKIFTYNFIDCKQLVLETKKDKEIANIYNAIINKKGADALLQKIFNEKDDSNSKKDSDKDDDKDADKTDKEETLTSSKKIVFRKNSLLIKESKEEIDDFVITLGKEFTSQFNKMYFINIYFFVETSLINARITSLYFSFINVIINAHKNFIENGAINTSFIESAASDVTKNATTCLSQIEALENKLGNNIFKVTETLSKEDVVISKESFVKEVSKLKDYYNDVVEQIQKISNELTQNLNKLKDAKTTEIDDQGQINLIKSLNSTKAFLDSTVGIDNLYQNEIQGLSKTIKSFDDDSILKIIDTITKDIDFYKNDSLSSTFITDESINIVNLNKSKINNIYKKYNENNISKALTDIKTLLTTRAKDVEQLVAKDKDDDKSKTQNSSTEAENPGDDSDDSSSAT